MLGKCGGSRLEVGDKQSVEYCEGYDGQRFQIKSSTPYLYSAQPITRSSGRWNAIVSAPNNVIISKQKVEFRKQDAGRDEGSNRGALDASQPDWQAL